MTPLTSRTPWRRVLRLLALDVVAAIGLAIILGLAARDSLLVIGFVPVWVPAAAIGVFAFLPTWRWPIWLVVVASASVVILIPTGAPAINIAFRVVGDVLVLVATALVVRRFARFPLSSLRDALALIAIASGVGLVRSVLALASIPTLVTPGSHPAILPVSFGLSGTVGMLTLMPMMALAIRRESWHSWSPRSLLASVLGLASIILATCVIFLQPAESWPLGTAFLLIPLLMLLASRPQQLPLAITLSAVALVTTYATAKSQGPLGERTDEHADPRLIMLNTLLFLFAIPATAWLLTAALAHVRDSTERLTEAGQDARVTADTDPATGLRSRSWVTRRIQTILDAATPKSGACAVMFVDFSEFELVRSSLGYEAADGLLRDIGSEIADATRSTGKLGRFDGDRLLLVVDEPADSEQLTQLALSTLAVIRKERNIGGSRLSREGSVGIAVSTETSTPASLLRNADLSLAVAAGQRTPGWKIFEDADDTSAGALELESDIRRGLERGEFVPYYQPQVRLVDSSVIGYEALIRWNHPERGVLSPTDFLPAAERSGLVSALGETMLEQICQRLRAEPDLPVVSFNLSATELADPLWAAILAGIADAHGISAGRLAVELTETTIFRITEDSRRAVLRLTSAGMALHVDDFGTGYSSVSHLRDMPVSGLKLDRSFVAALDTGGEQALALVTGVAGLANGLGLLTVAEGVETQEQAEALLRAGWIAAQGYLYGRPAPEPSGHRRHTPTTNPV